VIELRRSRPEDAAAVASVHVASWRHGYAASVPAAMLDTVTIDRRTAMWEALLAAHAETHPTLLAETEDGRIVGFGTASAGSSSVEGFAGEFHMIFLAPGFQRRDLGRRLFKALARLLVDRGAERAIGWALESPSACGFARGMGGIELGRTELEVPGGSVTQVLYAWRSLTDGALAGTGGSESDQHE
jgi:GNAT superfamily N-acetyltransferase